MRAFTLLFLTAATLASPAFAQDPVPGAPEANMEILIQKIRADKKLLVASNMELTDAEAKKFWPLYDAYQKELDKINKNLAKTIKEYADAYNKGPIANDKATKLLNEVLSVQESELKVRRAYAGKVGKVLPAAKTARYIQIENKIRAVLNFELARQVPLVY
jgi:Spy/CpxP family protein refolding chaperone